MPATCHSGWPAMNSTASTATKKLFDDVQDFSLVLGGPLYQLLRRARLSDDALRMVRRRMIAAMLLTWLPLLLLTLIDGSALSDDLVVPFLRDWELHIRFLVVVPLLVGAELLVHQRIRGVVQQFIERDLVPDAEADRFDHAIRSAFRLRNSIWAELVIVALVYGVGILVVWRHYFSLETATWYATPGMEGSELTLPGMWLAYVALPIFQFLLLRWFFRIFIWARFLWQVSRIPLRLSAANIHGNLVLWPSAMSPALRKNGCKMTHQQTSRWLARPICNHWPTWMAVYPLSVACAWSHSAGIPSFKPRW